MEKEIWKDIPDYEGLYQASNLGKIRSLDREVRMAHNSTRIVKGRLIKSFKNDGYNIVQLSKKGNVNCMKVSRLVWSAFNGKIPEGMQINHNSEIRDDDRLENLSLVTPKENINWGGHNERVLVTKANNQTGWLPIKQYTISGELVNEYNNIRLAEKKTGISNSNISQVCKGRRKTAGGYIWQYA